MPLSNGTVLFKFLRRALRSYPSARGSPDSCRVLGVLEAGQIGEIAYKLLPEFWHSSKAPERQRCNIIVETKIRTTGDSEQYPIHHSIASRSPLSPAPSTPVQAASEAGLQFLFAPFSNSLLVTPRFTHRDSHSRLWPTRLSDHNKRRVSHKPGHDGTVDKLLFLDVPFCRESQQIRFRNLSLPVHIIH